MIPCPICGVERHDSEALGIHMACCHYRELFPGLDTPTESEKAYDRFQETLMKNKQWVAREVQNHYALEF